MRPAHPADPSSPARSASPRTVPTTAAARASCLRQCAARVRRATAALLDPWLSRACGLCGQPISQPHAGLCRHCRLALPGRTDARCPRCGLKLMPMSSRGQQTGCGDCLAANADPLDAVCVLADYAPPLDRLVTAMKFHRLYAGAKVLGLELALALDRWQAHRPADEAPIALLVPVPLAGGRLRERGFDQTAVIARVLAARTGIACGHLLARRRETLAQSRLQTAARQENLRDAFALRKPLRLGPGSRPPGHVALVDDVMTTGATLRSAATALREAGVPRVTALVAARTGAPP